MKEKTGEREKVSIKRLEALPPHDLKLLLSVRKSPETRLTSQTMKRYLGMKLEMRLGMRLGRSPGMKLGMRLGREG